MTTHALGQALHAQGDSGRVPPDIYPVRAVLTWVGASRNQWGSLGGGLLGLGELDEGACLWASIFFNNCPTHHQMRTNLRACPFKVTTSSWGAGSGLRESFEVRYARTAQPPRQPGRGAAAILVVAFSGFELNIAAGRADKKWCDFGVNSFS